MPPICRLLSFARADGPYNMAADEAILESAVAGVASLRFYGWTEPTLSLGYFQTEQRRHDDHLLAQLPFVRRPTGGGALVHDHEVTYALALPGSPPWQVKNSAARYWIGRMHRVIADALNSMGISASCPDSHSKPARSAFLCFQCISPDDLLMCGAKVTGSAQRRQRGALLQHGAILLAASNRTPALSGIRELAKLALTAESVAAAIASECRACNGLESGRCRLDCGGTATY